MKISILAGESSGDVLGGGLLSYLNKKIPHLTTTGIGGPAMIKEGCHSLYNMERLSVMGFYEPLMRLGELIKIRRGILNHVLQASPNVFIGIDSPDFNLGLEIKIRKAGIPVIHYVSPSVWAWRQKRIHKIAKATDLVLTLFPFEEAFYQRHNVPSHFVGHPLADTIPLTSDKGLARQKLGINENQEYIALLPGSRHFELKNLATLFIASAEACLSKRPSIKFITSAANELRYQEFKSLCRKSAPHLPIEFFLKESQTVMAAADAVLVTSGTATLETMLIKRPMVVVYRVGPITFEIAKRMVKIPFIALPNLLANDRLVPEYIQGDAQPTKIAASLIDFLDNHAKTDTLLNQFTQLHSELRKNANEQAGEMVLKMMMGSN